MTAEQEGNLCSRLAKITDEVGEEYDWDEYQDEIASAAAFASLSESEINRRAWEADDGTMAAICDDEQALLQ